MKILIALLLGSFLIEAALLYYFPYIVLVIFLISAVTFTAIVYRNNQREVSTLHHFVVKPGFQPGTVGQWINVTTLAAHYQLEPNSYIVYDPTRTLELNDIVLVPLITEEDYVKFKEEAVKHFYEQRRLEPIYTADEIPYIYGT